MKLLDILLAPFRYIYNLMLLTGAYLNKPNDEDVTIANLQHDLSSMYTSFFEMAQEKFSLENKLEIALAEEKRLGDSLLDSLKGEFDLRVDLEKVQNNLDLQQAENIKQAAKLKKLRRKLKNR